MFYAKNEVLEGKYRGYAVKNAINVYISTQHGKRLYLNKETLEGFEVVTQRVYKSLTSALARGVIGSLLLGPVGAAAAATGRNKHIHLLALYYKEGGRSLVEVDENTFNTLTRIMF